MHISYIYTYVYMLARPLANGQHLPSEEGTVHLNDIHRRYGFKTVGTKGGSDG